MKKTILNGFYLLFVFFLLSCNQDDILKSEEIFSENLKIMSLNEKIRGDNPYSVGNMYLATEFLVSEGRLNLEKFPNFTIRTTHLYIKFTPKSEDEEIELFSDSNLVLQNYPIEIGKDEVNYEEMIPVEEDQFSSYYASIPVDYSPKYSGNFEILEKMYIPEVDNYFEKEDDDYLPEREISKKIQLHDEILYTAYFLKGLEKHLEVSDSESNNVKSIIGENKKPEILLKNEFLILDSESQERFKEKIPIVAKIIGKKWRPSGRLSYIDTSLVPNNITGMGNHVRWLPGACVNIRQGFIVSTAITGQDGRFTAEKTFRGKITYLVQWARYHYNIRNNSGYTATMDGFSTNHQQWIKNIQVSEGLHVYHSLIHVASLDYFYGNRFGLTSPRSGVKIRARYTNGCTSSHATIRTTFNGSDIILCEFGNSHSSIYGTTIHELAHSAHYQFNRPGYNKLVWDGHIDPWLSSDHGNPGPTASSARRTLETWATTVELAFVQSRYELSPFTLAGSGRNLSNKYRQLMQNQSINGMSRFYTSCGFDLIDNFNNRNAINPNGPIDRVSGYTIKQLENSLYGATNWNKWRDNIKSQHNNPTSIFVNELFANW